MLRNCLRVLMPSALWENCPFSVINACLKSKQIKNCFDVTVQSQNRYVHNSSKNCQAKVRESRFHKNTVYSNQIEKSFLCPEHNM